MSPQGSRWSASAVTFGPLGRVLCTVGLLGVPLWLAVFGGVSGLVGAVVWCGWLAPRALRDTWRRAPLPATDLTRLEEQSRRAAAPPPGPHPAFDDRAQPLSRW